MLAGADSRDLTAAADALGREHVVATSYVPSPPRVRVYVPPGYEVESSRRYPVLYFLHDARGDERILERRGVMAVLWREMKAGRLAPFVVVAPNGVGTWFSDSYDGRCRYRTYLTADLVPYIDATYRTVVSREARAAVGISMGGYGALSWGLAEPSLLSRVGGLSPAVQQLTHTFVKALPFFVRPSLERVFGRDARANGLRQNDLYDRLLSDPSLGTRAPRVSIRCGLSDEYRLGEIVGLFGTFLDAVGIRNDVVVEPGTHDWGYWSDALPKLFASVAQGLVSGTGS